MFDYLDSRLFCTRKKPVWQVEYATFKNIAKEHGKWIVPFLVQGSRDNVNQREIKQVGVEKSRLVEFFLFLFLFFLFLFFFCSNLALSGLWAKGRSFSFAVVHLASHATSSSKKTATKEISKSRESSWVYILNINYHNIVTLIYHLTSFLRFSRHMDRFPIIKYAELSRTRRRVLCWYSFVSRKSDTADYVETDIGECHYFKKRSLLHLVNKEHQEWRLSGFTSHSLYVSCQL